MTTRRKSLPRAAALSVAITLFAAPIASAQSPEAAALPAVRATTTLLSPSAFARLIQPAPTNVAPASVGADAPRPSLLRQATAAMARQAQSAPAQRPAAPPQKRWISRHKMVWIIPAVVGGAILGAYGLLFLIYGDD